MMQAGIAVTNIAFLDGGFAGHLAFLCCIQRERSDAHKHRTTGLRHALLLPGLQRLAKFCLSGDQKRAAQTLKAGRRTLISRHAADDWRRGMEQVSNGTGERGSRGLDRRP